MLLVIFSTNFVMLYVCGPNDIDDIIKSLELCVQSYFILKRPLPYPALNIQHAFTIELMLLH